MASRHRRLAIAPTLTVTGAQGDTQRRFGGVSIGTILYGALLHLSGQMRTAAEPAADAFGNQLRSAVPCEATRPSRDKGGSKPPPALFQASHVYVRPAGVLAPAYRGPFEVIKRSEKVFIVKIGQQFDAISIDRLKTHTGSPPPTSATPPARGRPKKPYIVVWSRKWFFCLRRSRNFFVSIFTFA
jgi:hypothetical protein